MPFAPADRASSQIGILQAVLKREGIAADELHVNLDLYDELRERDAHHAYASTLPALVGEWLFSRQPAPSLAEVQAASSDVGSPLTRLVQFARQWELSYDELVAFREQTIAGYVRGLVARDWSMYDIVAFTLTYPQINASFWLAEELKRKHPSLYTVFGGALSQIHLSSAAEYMRVYSFVDCFVVGEAEPVFGAVCARVLAGEDVLAADLPGVLARDAEGALRVPDTVALVERFDDAPFPDYRGFRDKRASLPAPTRALVQEDVPVEMARGCVWAVKKVCSFCGFYPDGGYRRKSSEVALRELAWQQEVLGWRSFYSLDAYLPHGLVSGVFRRIPEEQPGITFPFVELRTRMKRSELELLARAGVTLVQPGIECLEDGLLDKILKGVSLANNLSFLKWSKELGLEVSWNLLLGLPDATPAEMERQLEVIELIPHLAPPSPTRLLFVRGSTYQQRPESYGLENLRPDSFYRLLHPPELDDEKVAYEFQADWDMAPLEGVHERTAAALARWQARWRDTPPALSWARQGDDLVVKDGRDEAEGLRTLRLTGDNKRALEAILDAAANTSDVAQRAGLELAAAYDALAWLNERRLVVETRDGWLGLPVAEKPRRLSELIVKTQRAWRERRLAVLA